MPGLLLIGAWTTPRTWVANEVVTAAIMNTHVRDNLSDLDSRTDLNLKGRVIAVTTADCDNTASEVTIATATIVEALADGDSLVLEIIATVRNFSGSNHTISFDILYGGVEVDLVSQTANSNTTEGYHKIEITLIRDGSDVIASYGAMRKTSSGTDWSHVNGARLTAPTTTAGQTLSLKCTLAAAHSTFYVRPEAAALLHRVV